MKFIADAMLGRLARWLRLLGFDTLYFSDISDRELLKIARQENRFILTRDVHFSQIKNLKDYLLIRSNDTFEQLLEVTGTLDMKVSNLVSRCAKCNGILNDAIEKQNIIGLVPEHIYRNFNKFFQCRNCESIYWEGSHVKRFRERICGILKDV